MPVAAFADSTVIATADQGSSISPSGVTVVSTGVSQLFSVSADTGYTIAGVSLDGINQGTGSIDLIGDMSNHMIAVSSSAITPTGGTQPYCSDYSAPGWNVSLPDGGCGGTKIHIDSGAYYNGLQCPDSFVNGCMVN